MRTSFLRRQAFTLIELLVVIAVIAILIALLVPAVQKVRYVAARTQTTNNLKQCALASQAYHDAWKCLPFNGVASATSTDYTSGSWAYQILPYLDQQSLYDSQPANTSMAEPVPALLCAIRGRPGYYSYTAASTGNVATGLIQEQGIGTVGNGGEIGNGVLGEWPYTANPTFTFSPSTNGFYVVF